MNDLFRNREIRSIVIKLFILQLIFGIVGFIIIDISMDRINSQIVKRDMALIGSILNSDPELEDRIIPYITKEVSQEDIDAGMKILTEYGYHDEMDKDYQPVLKDLKPSIQMAAVVSMMFFIISLILIIMIEYRKVYKKIQEISNVAEKVVEGDFSIYLDEEGEGDFNILNHQFNQMTNRLENSLDTLKQEKTFLKNMISDISHQLKTPLSSLIILNDILIEDTDIDLETQIDFLEKSKRQLDRMEWLIINLLKVARIEAGAIEFKRENILLKDVLDISLKSLNTQLRGQEVSIEGNLESNFYGDMDWTAEALINIIKNAGEHGNGKIEIVLENTPLFSSIIIKDNGDGIDKKHIPYIFERFYKVSSEIKPESIGIGLNLSRVIIESQNGTISVRSKRGEGTEFNITFLKTSSI
ncbi:MAG: HAMP domain-containing sensor histidine kinase [Tissierellaceae bacterium]